MSNFLNITRWTPSSVGLLPHPEGEYVLFNEAVWLIARCKDCKIIDSSIPQDIDIGLNPGEVSELVIGRLTRQIKESDFEALSSYSNGYDDGFSAGGKFALLSEALNLDVEDEDE